MSDQERPSKPEPTESGPEVMQRRAEELRAMALQSKEQREQQLAADTTNPSDEMDVEEEGEKEEEKGKEKEKPAAQEENPETRASEAAEETES